jgi:glucose/arabinose dehydrogenase
VKTASIPLGLLSLALVYCIGGAPGISVDPPSEAGQADAPVKVPCDGCGSGTAFCDLPGENTDQIDVPDGFCAREFYAPRLLEARVIRFAPNGDIFIAAPSIGTPGGASAGPGAIVVLPDDNHDGVADSELVYAGGSPATAACSTLEVDPNNLSCVHGIAFSDGYLYLTRSDEVRRIRYSPGDRKARGASEFVANLGGSASPESRWTHTLDRGADGTMYVSRGRFESSGQCTGAQMTLGAVFSLPVGGGAGVPVTPTRLADGFRNPMYIRYSTRTSELYAAELTGDTWGGVGGREKLSLIKPGGRWGYPCCVAKGKPLFAGNESICADIGNELLSMPLNDTPFGFDFERGKFPAPYTNGVFFALHGAFGQPWRGTAIAWTPTDQDGHPVAGPSGGVQTFATGWSNKFPGRATDVAFAPDGRLFVIDDTQGRIFWIAPKTLKLP